jgi:hypothetical protein
MTTVQSPASLAAEMASAEFADRRLSRRLGLITEELARSPGDSLPLAFTGTAELEAAYRFFGNPKVTPSGILGGHWAALADRMRGAKENLVIHDTTKFVYRANGARRGLGRVMSSGQAFFGHFSLVLTDDGSRRPLGVGAVKYWARGDERSEIPERRRWLELVNEVHHRMQSAPMIHVMDREADDYALLCALHEGGHRFVIRAKADRFTIADDSKKTARLSEVLAQLEADVERTAPLTKRTSDGRNPKAMKAHPSRGSRIAQLSIAATTATLKRPECQPKDLPKGLELNVVRVWEREPPDGESPVEWILFTSEPVSNATEAMRAVDRYRARWTIEVFFKALKTGCAMEERQLMDFEALCNAATVFAPIAAMLLLLRGELDRAPDAPATNVVTERQLAVLRAWGKRPIPDEATVRAVVFAIGGMGGHVRHARTPPGWQTLARGLERLASLCESEGAADFRRLCDQR